jgi:hypothetical protein
MDCSYCTPIFHVHRLIEGALVRVKDDEVRQKLVEPLSHMIEGIKGGFCSNSKKRVIRNVG